MSAVTSSQTMQRPINRGAGVGGSVPSGVPRGTEPPGSEEEDRFASCPSSSRTSLDFRADAGRPQLVPANTGQAKNSERIQFEIPLGEEPDVVRFYCTLPSHLLLRREEDPEHIGHVQQQLKALLKEHLSKIKPATCQLSDIQSMAITLPQGPSHGGVTGTVNYGTGKQVKAHSFTLTGSCASEWQGLFDVLKQPTMMLVRNPPQEGEDWNEEDAELVPRRRHSWGGTPSSVVAEDGASHGGDYVSNGDPRDNDAFFDAPDGSDLSWVQLDEALPAPL